MEMEKLYEIKTLARQLKLSQVQVTFTCFVWLSSLGSPAYTRKTAGCLVKRTWMQPWSKQEQLNQLRNPQKFDLHLRQVTESKVNECHRKAELQRELLFIQPNQTDYFLNSYLGMEINQPQLILALSSIFAFWSLAVVEDSLLKLVSELPSAPNTCSFKKRTVIFLYKIIWHIHAYCLCLELPVCSCV